MPEKPEEKLLILQLSEDSRKISRILSNEISIRILKLLDRKSMSASDIADELGVRLNTLKYNLDSLLEVELIRVRQVKWSRKGREIKVYETVGKTIILLSGKKNSDMSLILTLLRHYNLKSPEKKDTSEISGLCCEHGI
ncbi:MULTISPECIES: ArsR/SmtB family transcription factor [Methanosarcina]|jgi:predicted transcriptional regulator|uniref:Transcriptional regulator n=4 Tax=Methanosarcina mazei TaxID=2209 RepID=A0A0F8HHY8_METMZ|nr:MULTISPECIES: helix-turn-helix domain-containing protein [Methanosarcina]AGF98438.1 transcriptional regulator [Methanosarcina mazei Tuc01]AKB40538.1 transcriptional regulator [Methanosarcina mazei WWM610]AKB68119.1 transcriptional regulator [Methanosarcina mazei LYC]KKF98710.1 transcriptional regulator [Methanosarcina mazei]KKF99683.1 transcriptional regulator [Methanosarcina mazei]